MDKYCCVSKEEKKGRPRDQFQVDQRAKTPLKTHLRMNSQVISRVMGSIALIFDFKSHVNFCVMFILPPYLACSFRDETLS